MKIYCETKAQKIFHSIENQHFNFINVDFFYWQKTEIIKLKI